MHSLHCNGSWQTRKAFPPCELPCEAIGARAQASLHALESGDITLAEFGSKKSAGADPVTAFCTVDYVRAEHATILALNTEAVRIASLPEPERAARTEVLRTKLNRELPGNIVRVVAQSSSPSWSMWQGA